MRPSRQTFRRVLAIGLLMTAGVAAAQAPTGLKVGIFDPNRVSAEAKEPLRAQQELQSKRDQKQADLSEREGKIQAMQQQLQQQALSLSAERRIALELDIQRQLLEINSKKELASRELQLELAAAEQRFNEQLNAVIGEFARQEGFDLILDTGAVAWASKGIDVTTGLIEKFNQMFPVEGQ